MRTTVLCAQPGAAKRALDKRERTWLRRGMGLLRVMLVAMMVLGARSEAEACSCRTLGIDVTPRATVVAPLNVQVRVTWPLPSGNGTGGISRQSKYRDVPVDRGPWTAAVALVTEAGVEVPSERRTLASGAQGILLLTPRKPLAALTKYRVVYEPKAATPLVLGEINTGKRSADRPVTWDGHAEAFLGEAPSFGCTATGPLVMVSLSKGSDPDMVFGVWPETGKIDSSTLLTIAPVSRDQFVLGTDSSCQLSNFEVSMSMQVTLRIAPIDIAGNMGVPVPVTIAPPKPTAPTSPTTTTTP